MGARRALAPVAARLATGMATVALGIAVATAGAAGEGSDPAQLTPEQVAAQVRAGQALQSRLTGAGPAVAAATANLALLADRSALFLQRLGEAQDARAGALRTQRAASAQAARLAADLAVRQDDIGRWAAQTYMSGDGRLHDLAAVVSVLANPDPARAADTVALLRYLADERSARFTRLGTAAARQADAAAAASKAAAEAAAAEADAAAARTGLDSLIEQQEAALRDLRAAEAAESAGGLAALLRSSTVGIDAELLAALGGGVPVTGTCRADGAAYPNGMLPATALCPMRTAPGKYLREAPARAFDAMSTAYRSQTGRPLCVTDAYRSYAQQVAVYAAKPHLAARPGTSQHGLGRAVDLCGGVQSFGDPAHLWMRLNGPLYGWYHPSWAGAGGSRPEPWHWEFAG